VKPASGRGPWAARLRLGTLLAVAAAASLAAAPDACGWGYTAHRIVTDRAARSVPEPLARFFAPAAGTLADLSLEPDSILRSDPEEAPRHYIDVELYVRAPSGLSGLPRTLPEARARYGEEALRENGILPWWIAEVFDRLTRAMRNGRGEEVARNAAHLSHYVADLHQPLHLTDNHDGQKTGQHEVHAAYERYMVEKHERAYTGIGTVRPKRLAIGSPAEWAIGRIEEVYPRADRILAADREAVVAVRQDKEEYFAALERRLGTMTRELLSDAARATAQLWYSAWDRADRPDVRRWKAPAARGKDRVE